MAAVTIVLPTYNRPALLDYAIRSVLVQSFRYWKLLVVGDACEESTANVVQSFGDPRIFYVNLQERCGEQSGPVSTGSMCATGSYIAYLNHDDLWLPDHLETALAKLQSSGADIFVGRAAFTTQADFGGRLQPAVNAFSPKNRTLDMAFYCKPTLFEPISSWVIKREFFNKVGTWSPARNLIRSPAEDWLLRAWRMGASIQNGSQASTIYCNAEKRIWVKNKKSSKPAIYTMPPEEQEFWWRKINRLSPPDIRALIRTQASSFGWTPDYFGHRYAGTSVQDIFEALLTPETAELYRWTGWDAMDPAARLTGRQHGASLAVMLKRRTGEELPAVENWDRVVEYGERQLRNCSNWFEYEC